MNIKISEEVKQAIKENRPVVALESTIISHGMSYPKNVQTALAVEKVIRDHGAIPATIGIIDGTPIVGMSPEEIESFGKKSGIYKASRRDLPFIIGKKLWGATTVATTMIFAHMANIKVFVTGGVGGVHRGAEVTMDVSADLVELATTPVNVVCAGIKAILDLEKTLEYLETLGVSVVPYKSENLADFYTPDSGIKLPYSVDSTLELAKCIKAKEELNLRGGFLISNPIPEDKAIDKAKVDKAIDQALKELDELGVKGKDSTPFLLKRITELTGGESLASNIELILNNAAVGAELAKDLCKLYE